MQYFSINQSLIKSRRCLSAAFMAGLLLSYSPASFATKCFTWVADANNRGYFITDDGSATYPNGTSVTAGSTSYTITTFKITQNNANTANLVGGVTAINSSTDFVGGGLGGEGFIWNGTAATQFWRQGGAATNGANFFTPDATSPAVNIWAIDINLFRASTHLYNVLIPDTGSTTVTEDTTAAACTPTPPITPVSAAIGLDLETQPTIFATEIQAE